MIKATVVQGKRVGRTLNFPTANLRLDAGSALPKRGVYAVYAWVDGARYAGIMNVGSHPTLPEGEPTVEAHLLDFNGDLYGRTLTVEPVHYLRPETRFKSVDALARQLGKDARNARNLLGPGP